MSSLNLEYKLSSLPICPSSKLLCCESVSYMPTCLLLLPTLSGLFLRRKQFLSGSRCGIVSSFHLLFWESLGPIPWNSCELWRSRLSLFQLGCLGPYPVCSFVKLVGSSHRFSFCCTAPLFWLLFHAQKMSVNNFFTRPGNLLGTCSHSHVLVSSLSL